MDTQLRTFLTVCETMNFTQAARKLFLTQPAVSHHIHGLEKKYGLPLFSHRGRTLELTPAGRTLAAYARLLQTDEALLARKMEACQRGTRQLTFGVTMTIGEYGIARPAARYLKAHPDVELTLIFGNTRELLQQLDQGKLDFALVEGYYPPDSYDHLLFRPVFPGAPAVPGSSGRTAAGPGTGLRHPEHPGTEPGPSGDHPGPVRPPDPGGQYARPDPAAGGRLRDHLPVPDRRGKRGSSRTGPAAASERFFHGASF